MSEEMRRRLAALSAEQRARLDSALRERGLADAGSLLDAPDQLQPAEPFPAMPRSAAPQAAPSTAVLARSVAELAFSLFFFSDDGAASSNDKYSLVIEAARFGDAHGFHALWTPERHFHPFGGLYPNPALLAAAVAASTQHIGIRAGSVVLPLHHPARIAEEWALLDNLSGGRAGVSFASGWVPEDFVLATTSFEERRETTLERLEIVRRLWRGEAVEFPLMGRSTPVAVRTFPRPIQAELPVWLTTSGSRETWVQAGRLGLNVLTGLLQGTVEQVAENIAHYREARSAAGHDPNGGWVTLMIHTFVGPDEGTVREYARGPLLQYLRNHLDMYSMQKLVGEQLALDVSRFSSDDKETVVEFAFERYFQQSGLFGTPQSCLPLLETIRASGVNEIGCLIDFGIDRTIVLDSLKFLLGLRDQARLTTRAVTGLGEP